MKKFRLVSTILAFTLIFLVAGFSVYASVRTQNNISNQIVVNMGKTVVGVSGSFLSSKDKENIVWEKLSTFEADNYDSEKGALNNQIWDKNYSKSPLQDINFNNNAKYKFRFEILVNEDTTLIINNLSPTLISQGNFTVLVRDIEKSENHTFTETGSVAISLEPSKTNIVEIVYTIEHYNKKIQVENNLTLSFEGINNIEK